MDNVVVMRIDQGVADLINYMRSIGLRHMEVVDEGTMWGEFHQQKDVVFVFKVAVELDYVRVTEAVVYPQLFYELLDHAVLLDGRF